MTDWAAIHAVRGDDGIRRCGWSTSTPDYVAYHDNEWGRPVVDEVRIYEKLCLEGFQSGLSWLTILRKRDGFRRAFAGFDPAKVARFTDRDIDRLLADAGIVRHRGKIEATIANARATLDLHDEQRSLAALMWSSEPRRRSRPVPTRLATFPPQLRSPSLWRRNFADADSASSDQQPSTPRCSRLVSSTTTSRDAALELRANMSAGRCLGPSVDPLTWERTTGFDPSSTTATTPSVISRCPVRYCTIPDVSTMPRRLAGRDVKLRGDEGIRSSACGGCGYVDGLSA